MSLLPLTPKPVTFKAWDKDTAWKKRNQNWVVGSGVHEQGGYTLVYDTDDSCIYDCTKSSPCAITSSHDFASQYPLPVSTCRVQARVVVRI